MKIDQKDDRESQKSQIGSRSTVDGEECWGEGQKWRARCSARIVGGRGTLDVRPDLSKALCS